MAHNSARVRFPLRLRALRYTLPLQRRRVVGIFAAAAVAVTGTIAVTEGADICAASGGGAGTGAIAAVEGADTMAAAGNVTITGTIARTEGADTSTIAGAPTVTGTIGVTEGADVCVAVSGASFPVPTSTSGHKALDQNGNVWLSPGLSAWSITDLSNANITTVLQDFAALGFKTIRFWVGGGYSVDATWNPKYQRKATGDNWWSGTAWQSSLGPAWTAADHVLSECYRLNLVAEVAFCGGNGTTGARPDWDAATNTDMTNAGTAIATRFSAWPHIMWEIMFDETMNGTTPGRIQALFSGINSVEGSSRRLRVAEPNTLQSVWAQYINPALFTNFGPSMNAYYDWGVGTNQVDLIEASYAEAAIPTGNIEPQYDASPNIGGNMGQALREANYSCFVEGGAFINYGHEDLWPFGKTATVSSTESLAYTAVAAHVHTVQAGYCWAFIAANGIADATYAPSGWVTTGQGSGGTKAACGNSNTVAVAYFPDNRTIAVDTTVITGTANVRLRWFDPFANSYSTIAASEAQQTGRSVTLPAARGDGTRDFVLVVDLNTSVDGTIAVTEGADTSSAAGTSTVTGTIAVTNAADTSSATGTSTVAGTIAVTEGADTSTAAGAPTVTGTAAMVEGADTSSAAGTPSIVGTIAVTEGPDVGQLSDGSSVFGTIAVTNAPDSSAAAGTPTVTGSVAVTNAPDTSSVSGAPSVVGSMAVTNAPDVMVATDGGAVTGTIAVTNAPDVMVAVGITITGPLTLRPLGVERTLRTIGVNRTLRNMEE